MFDEDLATALRRITELEAENAALKSEVAALGSTYETWRQVIELVRKRIVRWRLEERGGG